MTTLDRLIALQGSFFVVVQSNFVNCNSCQGKHTFAAFKSELHVNVT